MAAAQHQRVRPEKGTTGKAPALRSELWISAAIFGVALLVRLVHLYQHARNPTFDHPIVDSQLYDETARALVRGGQMGFGFFWQPFFYPLALSAVYAVSGCSLLAARVVQLVVGALTCVLTYHLGRRVFDRKTGIVAGLTTAFYGPLVFFESELIGAGWAAFWSVILMLVLLWATERRTAAACFCAGLCAAISITVRPAFLPFVLVAGVYLLVVLIRQRKSWATLLGRTGLALIGFALAALPIAAKSKAAAGCFSMLPASGGLNLYIGNNPDRDYTLTVRPGDEWMELQNEAVHAGQHTPLARSRFFSSKVRRYVIEQPLAFAGGLAHKAVQFLNGREVPRNIDVYVFREWSSVLSLLVWKWNGFGFPWTLLLALAVIGLGLQRARVPLLMKLFVLLYPAAVVLVFVAGRYRVPVVPVCAVLAAAGAVEIARLTRAAKWRSLGLAGGLGLIVVVLTSLPGPAPEERIDYGAEMYVLLADGVHEEDPQQAIAWYQEALRRDARSQRAHSHLAAVLAEHGDPQQALSHFEPALDDPRGSPLSRAFVHYERAKALAALGDRERALADLDRAIELHPRFGRALIRRGRLHRELGQSGEARRDWQRALDVAVNDNERQIARQELALLSTGERVPVEQPPRAESLAARDIEGLRSLVEREPDNAQARDLLGNRLSEQHQYDEALPHLRAAVELAPGPKTRYDLAVVLLKTGRSAEAQAELEQVVAAAPSAAAWQNLAVAHAQQGQFERAVAAFESALELDPTLTDISYNLARALDMLGRAAEAIEVLERALAREPDDVRLLAALAWRLATASQAELRDGPRAVDLAERAVSRAGPPDIASLDAQAAAYAEVGRFDDAARVIQQVLELARRRAPPEAIRGFEARLRLYEQRRPYRQNS